MSGDLFRLSSLPKGWLHFCSEGRDSPALHCPETPGVKGAVGATACVVSEKQRLNPAHGFCVSPFRSPGMLTDRGSPTLTSSWWMHGSPSFLGRARYCGKWTR